MKANLRIHHLKGCDVPGECQRLSLCFGRWSWPVEFWAGPRDSDPTPPELKFKVSSAPAPLPGPGTGMIVLDVDVPTGFHYLFR